MVLVLKNDQMKDLLPMGEEIDAIEIKSALEQAFYDIGPVLERVLEAKLTR